MKFVIEHFTYEIYNDKSIKGYYWRLPFYEHQTLQLLVHNIFESSIIKGSNKTSISLYACFDPEINKDYINYFCFIHNNEGKL